MKNDRGITLLEVLLALAVSSILMGIIFSTFSAVGLQWRSTLQRYNDDTQYQVVSLAITNVMSDVEEFNVPLTITANKELRFKAYEPDEEDPVWKTLYFDSANKKLSIYHFGGDANIAPVATLPNPNYTNGVELATNVKNVAYTSLSTKRVHLSIEFEYKKADIYGKETSVSVTKDLVIKAISDSTAK